MTDVQTAVEEMIHLDPSHVLADDNARFGLKQTRVDSLKASILSQGAVLEPVEVEAFETPDDKGRTHRLTSGFYRHRAVEELNREGAGLTLPAIVRDVPDDTTRLRHQLAENMERENQSPMDRAIALKKLADAGVSKVEIRQMFASAGGRKGNQVQAMSNAMLNIYLNLLNLPKGIQGKIHEGLVGVEAAYLLGKVPRDKMQAVLERAEGERIAQVDMQEKDEARYLREVTKVTEAEAKELAVEASIVESKESIATAAKLVDEKTRALRAVQALPYLDQPDEVKRRVVEGMKAAETDLKGANRAEKDAKNAYAKALKAKTTITSLIEEQKAKLEEARKNRSKKGKPAAAPIGAAEVKKAAVGEKVGGSVLLSIQDIRQTVKDVVKETTYPKVALIGLALAQCFNGVTTTKQLIEDLAVQTGERKAPVLLPAAPAQAAPIALKAVGKK